MGDFMGREVTMKEIIRYVKERVDDFIIHVELGEEAEPDAGEE